MKAQSPWSCFNFSCMHKGTEDNLVIIEYVELTENVQKTSNSKHGRIHKLACSGDGKLKSSGTRCRSEIEACWAGVCDRYIYTPTDPQPFAERLMVFWSNMKRSIVLYQGGPALRTFSLHSNEYCKLWVRMNRWMLDFSTFHRRLTVLTIVSEYIRSLPNLDLSWGPFRSRFLLKTCQICWRERVYCSLTT